MQLSGSMRREVLECFQCVILFSGVVNLYVAMCMLFFSGYAPLAWISEMQMGLVKDESVRGNKLVRDLLGFLLLESGLMRVLMGLSENPLLLSSAGCSLSVDILSYFLGIAMGDFCLVFGWVSLFTAVFLSRISQDVVIMQCEGVVAALRREQLRGELLRGEELREEEGVWHVDEAFAARSQEFFRTVMRCVSRKGRRRGG